VGGKEALKKLEGIDRKEKKDAAPPKKPLGSERTTRRKDKKSQ